MKTCSTLHNARGCKMMQCACMEGDRDTVSRGMSALRHTSEDKASRCSSQRHGGQGQSRKVAPAAGVHQAACVHPSVARNSVRGMDVCSCAETVTAGGFKVVAFVCNVDVQVRPSYQKPFERSSDEWEHIKVSFQSFASPPESEYPFSFGVLSAKRV
jgi:hypothetical protein